MEFIRKYLTKKQKTIKENDDTIEMNSIAEEVRKLADIQELECEKHQEKAQAALNRGLHSDAERYIRHSADSKAHANKYLHKAMEVEIENAERKTQQIDALVSKQLYKAIKIIDNPSYVKRMKKVKRRFQKFDVCIETAQRHKSNQNISLGNLGISPSTRPRSQSLCDTLDMQHTFSSAPTVEYEAKEKDEESDKWYMTPETQE